MTDVYLEIGKRRVFACAIDWPGWCRSGPSEEAALASLAAYAPRYAVPAALAGHPFDQVGAVSALTVTERVTGTATTDFGALDVPIERDREPLAAPEAARLAAFAWAAWDLLGQVAAQAPAELRKGPRGGGRNRDQIIEHVAETEILHARMLGLKQQLYLDPAGVRSGRGEILASIRAWRDAAEGLGAGRQPCRFVARRIVWHALDHAWEIQDRQETTGPPALATY